MFFSLAGVVLLPAARAIDENPVLAANRQYPRITWRSVGLPMTCFFISFAFTAK